jgi:integrase/recombinase XerD
VPKGPDEPAEDRQANLYRRGKTWYGRIWINNREIRKSLRTSDEQSAKSRLKELRDQELNQAAIADTGRITWMEAVASWLEEIAPNVAPQTLKRYLVSIRQVEPWLKPLYLDEITRRKLKDVATERRRNRASNATIRRDLTAVSSVLDHAIDNDWTEDNPTIIARKKLKERREPIALPEDEHINFAISRAPGNMAHLIFAASKRGAGRTSS